VHVNPTLEPVEDKFQDILSKVTKKSGRSRLEPYGELIDELRACGLTYRDIADVLTDELKFHVPKSTVNDFMRERARRRRNAIRQVSRRVAIPPLFVPKAVSLHSGQGPGDEEVRQRIAALKARKPATTKSDNGFYFDPAEPLRLIDPGKRKPEE
jgi:ribosomal protein S19